MDYNLILPSRVAITQRREPQNFSFQQHQYSDVNKRVHEAPLNSAEGIFDFSFFEIFHFCLLMKINII